MDVTIRIKVKETGEEGELFEESRLLPYCSVFIDGEQKCRYYKKDEIEIINKEK